MSDLQALAEELRSAKEIEAQARHQRELVEVKIYRAALAQGIDIPEKGTVNLGPVKIVTTVGESWDQEELHNLAKVMDPEYFPFTPTWKPDARGISTLSKYHPNEYRKLMVALTTKPRKPSFQLKGEVES